MIVRRMAHAMGYRYRFHRKDLPGSPDLVFPGRRKVVFVHGCFWHSHSDPDCRFARTPKTRIEFWTAKIARNIARDAASAGALKAAGWQVLTVWECETKVRDREPLSNGLREFLA